MRLVLKQIQIRVPQIVIIMIIIVLFSIDSGDVDAQPTPLWESCHRSLWPLQITITLTEGALLIFFAIPELKNCWHGRPGIEPTTTTLNLSSQSGAYDLSATATPSLVTLTNNLAYLKAIFWIPLPGTELHTTFF